MPGSSRLAAAGQVLKQRDPRDPRRFLIDVLVDQACEKGTGRWTSTSSLELGVAVPTITEAVCARQLSSMVEQRRRMESLRAEGRLRPLPSAPAGLKAKLHDALYAAKIAVYAQGFQLMREASRRFGWHLALDQIALIWRGGCIIRGRLLESIYRVLWRDPEIPNLLCSSAVASEIAEYEANWLESVIYAVKAGIPAPCLSSALSYYDMVTACRLPSAAMVQGLRDYFGSHGFELVDRPGEKFTLEWHDASRALRVLSKPAKKAAAPQET